MGNKVMGELFSSVRSVLGQEFSDMDIIRALHLANNDITAAINIIFDTPRSSPRGSALPRKNFAAEPGSEASVVLASDSPRRNGKDENRTLFVESGSPGDDEIVVLEAQSKPSTSTDSDWWLVGSSELSGLSTCKGRPLEHFA